MSGEEENQLKIKFRLNDGSDIGPTSFPSNTSVASLKNNLMSHWPKEKENGPRTANDIKLISAGKILENTNIVGDLHNQLCDNTVGTTMHVVVQPPPTVKEKKLPSDPKQNNCGGCVIL